MSPVKAIQHSLKTRMVLAVGTVITLLMMGISLGILLQWRSLILNKLHQRAESVTRAFSISVLDALIYSENGNFQAEDLLESYINDLKQQVPGLRYIAVLDNQLRVVAHSDPSRYNRVYRDSLSLRLQNARGLVSHIYSHPRYGWVIETGLPLQIAGKRWGILRMAFDAEKTRAEIRHLFFLLLSVTTLVISATLLVVSYLIGRLVQSLEQLVEAMDKIDLESDRSLEIAPSLHRADEIAFLIEHFEMLRQRLAQSRRQLIQAQKQIYHAEKLASIGRLASGVAHEINNPLNGIKNCVYAIQRDPEDKEQFREYLQLINEGLNHIETVVQKLLGFARKQSKSIEPVDMNEAVRRVLQLMEYRINQKQISLELNLMEPLPSVKADYHLMQEVLMNLLLNSYDAVKEGGRIQVQTDQPDAGHIRIIIRDDGVGIPPEELPHIFDPFYTTKEPGEGTGLGLSVALGIVESHGGTIEVQSTPGKETEFRVILPLESVNETL